ncbi:hypothetical protein ACJJTC_003888 [Scirpophaga incertulas]
MNFAPFTGHIPSAAAMPSIQQFAAKFGYEGGGGGVVQEARYQPASAVHFVPVEGVKFRQAESVVVVSSAQPTVTLTGIAPIHTVNTGVKYQTISASSSSVNLGNICYGAQTGYVQAETVQHLKAEQRVDKREYREELHHDLMATMMQQQDIRLTQAAPLQQGTQQLLVVLHEPKEAAALARAIKQETRQERAIAAPAEFISIGDVSDTATWQTLGGGVADYLSALPLPLHHLLKYSADGKRDEPTIVTVTNALPSMPAIGTETNIIQQVPTNVNSVVVQTATIVNQTVNTNAQQQSVVVVPPKKKKKKKSNREKKPRPKPGEIRLTTALDGSTLYCCPECHMAYPERGLLEQHLVGHTMERRFICDICNAALKRKDHLTRHKQSHNPERPHACSVCLKAFKRKEQLTLHFVIHSGEKRHVCNECGKGFYRKDHLRKHTRSHIARRVKAELSQQSSAAAQS